MQARLFDENGDFLLYRQIHPINVPDLSFAGYNSSFFSPLSAEVSAVWIGSYLGGHHKLPTPEVMLRETRGRSQCTTWTRCSPTWGLDVPRRTKAKQWLMPVTPADYRKITPQLARRLGVKAR